MWEFLKIGLFAIGGGLVTIPFLFDISERYDWVSNEELGNIIGISQSLPGAMGINMGTYVGIEAAGIWGGIIAAISLVVPAIVVILCMAGFIKKHSSNPIMINILKGIRAAVVALILIAVIQVAEVSIVDIKTAVMCVIMFAVMCFYKKSPAFYIIIGALSGLVLQL
jgi:chromate transporter